MLGKKISGYEFNYRMFERYQFDNKNAQFYLPRTKREYYKKDERGISYVCRDIDGNIPIVFQSYQTIVFFARICGNGSALAPSDRILSVFYSRENMHYSRTTCKQTRQAIRELMQFYGCKYCTMINLDKLLVDTNSIHTIHLPPYEWRSLHKLEMYLTINYDFRVGHACVWCS